MFKKLGPPDDLKLCLKREKPILFSDDLSIHGTFCQHFLSALFVSLQF